MLPSPDEATERSTKRPRPIEATPKSIESELREQSMTSLLELMRTDSGPVLPPTPNSNINGMTNGPLSSTQEVTPIPSQSQHIAPPNENTPICETCLHRRARVCYSHLHL
jgi:hypothetical protein